MNPYPFWRLLLRPSMPLWIAGLWMLAYLLGVEVVGALIPDDLQADGQFALRLGRSLLMLSAIIGVAASQALQEAQHSLACFHLPGLRSGYRSGVALTALAAAAITTAAYLLLGGSEALTSIALLNLAGFGMGLALFDPLGSLWLTLVNLVALLGASASLHGLTGWLSRHPLGGLAIGVLILSWIGVRTLSDNTFRRKPFVPTLALISYFSLPVEKHFFSERLRVAAPRERSWPFDSIGDSSWRWIRAAIHGAAGFRRLGWVASNVTISIVLAIVVLAMALLDGAEKGGGLALGMEYAYRSLAYSASTDPLPQINGIDYWAPNWFAGAFWATMAFGYPVLLQTQKVYPLSRRHLGKVIAWIGTLQVGVLALSSLISLAALSLLLAWQTGYPWWPGGLPALLRTVLFNALLLPLVQWWRLAWGSFPRWKPWTPASFIAGSLAYCGALTLGVQYWTQLATALGPLIELLLLTLLIIATQWTYRRQVVRHFLKADLVSASGAGACA